MTTPLQGTSNRPGPVRIKHVGARTMPDGSWAYYMRLSDGRDKIVSSRRHFWAVMCLAQRLTKMGK